MNKIVVFTCITGNRDLLKDNQVKGGAEFRAYSETPQASTTWDVYPAPTLFNDKRRNARYVKLLPHTLFDADYSIWLDGSIEILVEPEKLIEKYLQNANIAVFSHPDRKIWKEEAEICMQFAKTDPVRFDDPLILQKQIDKYNNEYINKPLAETKVVIRRHAPAVNDFNEKWFYELTTNSKRDQISFPYVATKTNSLVNFMPPLHHPEYNNGEFKYYKHND